jgi:hypothetical protein
MDKNKKTLALKQFLVYIVSSRDIHITDILTEIRAIKGVVTVSIFESSKKLDEERNLTKVKLKFLQFSEIMSTDLKQLKKNILLIDGISSIIMKIKKSDIDRNVSDMFDKSNIPRVQGDK